MTRRKKTKSAANQNLNQLEATTSVSEATAAGSRVSTVHNASSVSNPGNNVPHSSTSSATAPSSNSCSASTSSRISNATTSFSDNSSASTSKGSSGKASEKCDPKKIKTIVKYITKQIYIHTKFPILTVERLSNLDNHVRVLTESIGWRPRVYQHEEDVRFIPGTQKEYRIIESYLAKIEAEDSIAWYSYHLPPGKSLEVNIKVRVIETVEIENELQKLQIQNTALPNQTK